jgi:triacylglycerol lipase
MTCRVSVAGVFLCGSTLALASSGCANAVPDDGTASAAAVAPSPSAKTPADTPETQTQSVNRFALTSGYTQTRYPIILAHGMSGWKEMFGVFDYFYHVADDLRSSGAKVYVTTVAAFASSEDRGEQLLEQVEYIAAASGAGKVNLIGHSQGGLDVRYVLGVRPDLIASVTTVGTPHAGAGVADWLLDHVDANGFAGIVAQTFANSLGFIIECLAGTSHPEDSLAALEQVSTAGLAVFNAKFPAGLPATSCASGAASYQGVALFSWSGVHSLTNVLDVTDTPLGIASLFAGEDSDGLVGQCASHFGTVVRDDYRMNHLDEVNQILGLTSLFESSPSSVYRAHANRLKNLGM